MKVRASDKIKACEKFIFNIIYWPMIVPLKLAIFTDLFVLKFTQLATTGYS